ncbi:MAG: LPS export ABC transporter periplasmic protein LptC [Chitinophagaceae bacterium]|nr:LPS export ABC transporter periplasmic protein LptC [Chitinophagaceae bacterium]
MPLANVISKRLVLAIVVCFFMSACENDETAIDALTRKRLQIDEGVKIVSYFSSDGKVKAKLTAPLMRNYQTDSPYIEFPNTLHVDFFNDSTDAIESQLNARYGKYRENEKKVFLKDSVEVFNISGDTLRSMELWWDQQRKEFYTDKPARIYRSDHTVIYGRNGLTASQDFSDVTIHEASGVAPLPKDAGLN